MADYGIPFELRKLQWRFSRTPTGGTVEDVAVITFHIIKSAAPSGPWDDTADLAAAEALFVGFWETIKPFYMTTTKSDQFRWYKDGPAFYELNGDGTAYVPIGGNPAVRVTEQDSGGTAVGGGAELPPQVALSVTERVGERKHWGRFYLPAPVSTQATLEGRVDLGMQTAVADAAKTMYDALKSGGHEVVVFSIQKPERLNKRGKTLAAQPAAAFGVRTIQVDDLWDIIRRRRYDHPTLRLQRAIAGS